MKRTLTIKSSDHTHGTLARRKNDIVTRSWTRALLIGACGSFLVGACSSSDDTDDDILNDDTNRSIVQLSPATAASLQGTCEALASSVAGLTNTSIDTSSEVPAGDLTVGGNDIPAHCLVTGKMNERTSEVDGNAYAISFEMRLPINWNGRFYHQGNGGIDGNVRPAVGASGGGAETNALYQGFAVLSSDGGHDASLGPTFGIDPQARLDYGYQATQTLTPMANTVISSAYGRGPDRSYFGGCSNGGRHAFNAFTRMPESYDGYLAGAPGYNLPKAAIANIFGAQRYATVATDPTDLSSAFTAQERGVLAASVLSSCDTLDGVADGIVADVQACQLAFSLDDVPTCDAERDGSCLSEEQKVAIAPIFSGATTSDGTPVYASFAYDAGIAQNGVAFWEFVASLNLDSGAVGMIFGTPPEDPVGFDGPAFSLSADIDDLVERINATNELYTESGLQFATPPDPTSLSAVRDRGAKIMVYHGVSDSIFSAMDSVSWIEGVQANHADASEFARLFLVPGMGHCNGGPSTDQFDALSALVSWVEQGEAPDQLLASARGTTNPGGENEELPADWSGERTRPLCPYPQVARYDGSGDVELAESFACE
ncbi:MAG: tannase/feruloyl esterase family alpha/beta hydrolase [Granulosicoccus sp.]